MPPKPKDSESNPPSAPEPVPPTSPVDIFTSPTINVRLIAPSTSKPATEAPAPEQPNPKKRKLRSSGLAKAEEDSDIVVLKSFNLHVSVLKKHSEYFTGLFSFNGIEVAQDRVDFVAPEGLRDALNIVAFSCFATFLYSGTYNLADYSFMSEEKSPQISFWCNQLLHQTAIYVLGDRLLCNGLKKETLKQTYNLLLNYLVTYDKNSNQYTEQELQIYCNESAEIAWNKNMSEAIRMLFDNTTSNTEAASQKTFTGKAKLYLSQARMAWIGKDPMRNLLAAFVASIWHITISDYNNTISESRIKNRHHLISDPSDYEFMSLMLSYNVGLRPYSVDAFKRIPLSDFGLEGVDRRELYKPVDRCCLQATK
ncbi:hypothetical protein BJ508DRAFT_313617 [Ascobolus immersus RN42]|uniref:BTB domain-containing protein n=1 Tax=Ascobolus immersus RN42 TaxID=1160509 RepID=A0A3N4HI56_ASCIM|nr:hypothetical protein BJ508DRAFT_313617 [Ascobolus immersus RN42]